MHNTNTPNAFFLARRITLIEVAGEVKPVSLDYYDNNPLWPVLIDTVHTLTMFPHHKTYVRDVVLIERPQTGAEELALKLGISLGESLVILYELEKSRSENLKPSDNLNR